MSRASHVPKNVINMLMKCFRARIFDFKWFGGRAFKNNQDVL